MSSRFAIRRARAGRTCTECRRYCIVPGEFYLVASMPPEHELNGTGRWLTVGACVACADAGGLHTEATRAALSARQQGATRP